MILQAVWSRFLPAAQRAREEVVKGTIGDVKSITVNFCKQLPCGKRALGNGTMMSLGVYPLQLVLAVCGPEMPVTIQACGTLNDDGKENSRTVLAKK